MRGMGATNEKESLVETMQRYCRARVLVQVASPSIFGSQMYEIHACVMLATEFTAHARTYHSAQYKPHMTQDKPSFSLNNRASSFP